MGNNRGMRQGSIKKRTDGRYEVRVTAGLDFKTGLPHRISKYARTKTEASHLLKQLFAAKLLPADIVRAQQHKGRDVADEQDQPELRSVAQRPIRFRFDGLLLIDDLAGLLIDHLHRACRAAPRKCRKAEHHQQRQHQHNGRHDQPRPAAFAPRQPNLQRNDADKNRRDDQRIEQRDND